MFRDFWVGVTYYYSVEDVATLFELNYFIKRSVGIY